MTLYHASLMPLAPIFCSTGRSVAGYVTACTARNSGAIAFESLQADLLNLPLVHCKCVRRICLKMPSVGLCHYRRSPTLYVGHFPQYLCYERAGRGDYLLSSSVQIATRFQSASLNMSPTPWPSAEMRLAAMPYLLVRRVLTASARSRAMRMLISGLPSGEA